MRERLSWAVKPFVTFLSKDSDPIVCHLSDTLEAVTLTDTWHCAAHSVISRHSRFWHPWFCYHLATVLHLWSAAVRRCRRWTVFTSQLHDWRTTGQCALTWLLTWRSVAVRHVYLTSRQRGRSSQSALSLICWRYTAVHGRSTKWWRVL